MTRSSTRIVMSLILGVIFLISSTTSAFADGEKKKWYDILKISGLIFVHYGYDAIEDGESTSKNNFNVYRGYLNFKVNINDIIKFRITPDVVYKNDDARFVYLKYALATFAPLKYLQITAGMQGTPWTGGYVNSFDGLRVLEKPFLDRTKMFSSSSDIGLAIHSGYKKKTDRLFGMLDYWVGILNGEGYKNFDLGSLKDFAARVGIVPVDNDNIKLGAAVLYNLHFGDTFNNKIGRSNLIAGLVHFHLKKAFYIHLEGFVRLTSVDGDNDEDGDGDIDEDDADTAIDAGFSTLIKGHLIKDRLDIFARWDSHMERDPQAENEDYAKYEMQHLLKTGLNIMIHKKHLWVLPNFVYEFGSSDEKYTYGSNNVQLNVEIQGKF